MLSTYKVEVCVSSKLYDLVAKSAKLTLWEMGYKKMLDISREIYFSFDVSAENRDKAEGIVSEIIKKTSLLVNPNRDSYRVKRQTSNVKSQKSIDVLIWYIEDKRGESIRNSLKNQGFLNVSKVFQGELWHFFMEEKNELVREMVEGFLANPHSQRYEILNSVCVSALPTRIIY